MANIVTAGESVSVKLDTAKLDAIVRGGLDNALREAVRSAAFDVEYLAKAAAPIETGAMASSIHTAFSWQEGGDYGTAVSAARSRRPGVGVHPETKPIAQGGGAAAIIGAAVEYAGFVEYGTSRMAAQPFLRPALARVKPGFKAKVAALLEGLAR